MKRFLILLIFLMPVLANAQVRSWQISSRDTTNTAMPEGTLIEADGNGSFQFSSGVVDSLQLDGTILKLWTNHNTVPDSVDLLSLVSDSGEIDSMTYEADNYLRVWQNGNTVPDSVLIDISAEETDPVFSAHVSSAITESDTALWNIDNDATNEIDDTTNIPGLRQFVENHSINAETDPAYAADSTALLAHLDSDLDTDPTNELEMPQNAIDGQLAIKQGTGWVAVDPCDIVCYDTILAIIKSYHDTVFITNDNGDVSINFDRINCVDSLQLHAAYFVSNTLNLKEIIIETVPVIGSLIYNGSLITGGDTLNVVNNDIENSLYYVSTDASGSEYYDGFTFKTKYASNTSYSAAFDFNLTVSECVEELLCFASDLSITQDRASGGNCATSTIITPGDLSAYPYDLQNVVITSVPTTGTLSLGTTTLIVGDTLAVSSASFTDNLYYYADENTTSAYLDTTTFETLCSADGPTATGSIYIDIEACTVDSFLLCLNNSLVFEDTLSFIPAAEYSSLQEEGSGIVEDSSYIFIIMGDSEDGDLAHHQVVRYNKITGQVDSKQITTTNAYTGDNHKRAVGLITSNGSLLVACEQLTAGGSAHGSPFDLFRWPDPSDLNTYSQITLSSVGSYPFLVEVNDTIYLDYRCCSSSSSDHYRRSFVASTDDGVNWGSETVWAQNNTGGDWLYSKGAINQTPNDSVFITGIWQWNYSSQVTNLTTLVKTKFSSIKAMDGTDLGAVVDSTELKDNITWGITDFDASYAAFTSRDIYFGDYSYNLALEDDGVSRTVRVIRINKNTGFVEEGVPFSAPSSEYIGVGNATFHNVCGTIICKWPKADSSIVYYEVAQDLSGIDSVYSEPATGGGFSYYQTTGLVTRLVADFRPSTNSLRVFRFEDPDEISTVLCDSVSDMTVTLTQQESLDSMQLYPSDFSFCSSNVESVVLIDTASGGAFEVGGVKSVINDTIPVYRGEFIDDVYYISGGNDSYVDTVRFKLNYGNGVADDTMYFTVNVTAFVPVTNLDSGLLHLYDFNEIAGTTSYDSVATLDMTITNATLNQTSVTNLGTSYLFDGVNDKVRVDSGLEDLYDFTLGCWINPTSVINPKVIISLGYGGGAGTMRFGISSDSGKLNAVFKNASNATESFTFNYAPTEGVWTHIGITRESGALNLYVNGQLEETHPSVAPTVVIGTGVLEIGYFTETDNSAYYYYGKLDQPFVFNRAITEEEFNKAYGDGDGLPLNQWYE